MEKLPIRKDRSDVFYEVKKAVASVVPVVGGPLQVLFENIFTSPLEKRQDAWFEKLAEVVEGLEQKVNGFTFEKLRNNDEFITIALLASQIALRNHQKEKIEALRNAVFNSALPNSPKVDIQAIFLRWIDQFTPAHLRILAFLNDPNVWMENNRIKHPGWLAEIYTIIQTCVIPEFKLEFINQIIYDLKKEGLVKQGEFFPTTGQGMYQSRTTEIGKAFLVFITTKDL